MTPNFSTSVSVFAVLVSCLVFSATASFTEEDLIADAGDLGRIKGVNLTSVSQAINGTGRPFIAFRGMRYAEAPIGARRFLPSVRATGRLNATGDYEARGAGLPCIQPGINPPWISEDCLTINVYTPKPYNGNDTDLLPVIFYIHGGSFTIGEGNRFNGNRMMNRDVVHVTFNYRLGVLGFFTMNTETSPGNAAMYDMINALDWTRDYIRYFGGDPNKITIAGQSSGAVAVTHLLVSPMATGKFQGAIAGSGSALAAWGTTESHMPGSLAIAALSGCFNATATPLPNITAIEECMRINATAADLVAALYIYQRAERKEARLGFDVISPIVQSFVAQNASFVKFLPEHPKKVFEEGRQADVPLMMGIPNEYGVYDSIAKIYLGDERKSGNFSEMYPGFIDLFSVFFFKASAYQTALYQSKINNNTYWYSFDFQGRQTVWNSLFPGEVPPFRGGITHGDDMIYLFYIAFGAFDADEFAVSNRMLDYWANFATTGNPTPASSSMTPWAHLTIGEERFVSIGKDTVEQAYYDDSWSGAGWEVVPPTEPTTTVTPTETPHRQLQRRVHQSLAAVQTQVQSHHQQHLPRQMEPLQFRTSS
ncbi:Carboxylesterase 4A [Orchesella cincta]|uniref:Carboxylic ester hydrolase n=1 Tax=Orchesella cincta TaxID=48709 RepID=A0A1D2MZP7_ORCCI|nr:Carboxylesterase 4A [Orchesella cincta]